MGSITGGKHGHAPSLSAAFLGSLGAAGRPSGGAKSWPLGHEEEAKKVARMQQPHGFPPHGPWGRNLFVPEVTREEHSVKAIW